MEIGRAESRPGLEELSIEHPQPPFQPESSSSAGKRRERGFEVLGRSSRSALIADSSRSTRVCLLPKDDEQLTPHPPPFPAPSPLTLGMHCEEKTALEAALGAEGAAVRNVRNGVKGRRRPPLESVVVTTMAGFVSVDGSVAMRVAF